MPALIKNMDMRGRLILAGCAVAFLVVAFIIIKVATATEFTTVMVGADPKKAPEIQSTLAGAGIKSEIVNAGTEVRVPKGKEDAARTALATAGLNTPNTQPGFAETLDKQKLGASNLQQEIAYQRGLEGEIANAIGQIQGTDGATVRLTLPRDELFADEEEPATAAVLLGSDGSRLDPAAVKGIANLVASSVPELKPENVTITNNAGSMLWPTGDEGSAVTSANTKAAAEAARARATETKLNALLANTLGPGKAQVQVSYDLNMDKSTEEKLEYGRRGTPVREELTDETLRGTAPRAGGEAGTHTNVPTYAGAITQGNGNSNYRNRVRKREMAVDKTITKTDRATGTVNRMDIGVLLDASLNLNPAQVADLQRALQSAAGFQEGRDTINITQVEFAKPEEEKQAIPAAVSGVLKGLAIGLGSLLFLFFIIRYLRKRETDELMDEPSWLKQLPQPEEPTAELPFPEEQPPILETLATKDPRRQALEEIVQREPERVAAHLRAWLTEDANR